jgi:hypothetical protein
MKRKTGIMMVLLLVAALAVPLLTSAPVLADETATRTPGTVSTVAQGSYDDVDWTNANNVKYCDNITANATIPHKLGSTYYDTYILRATNFAFTIPTNATITSITVTIRRYAQASDGNAAGNPRSDLVQLTKNGADPVGDNAGTNPYQWGISMADVIYPHTPPPFDPLWGTTWSPSDINAPTFGVLLSVRNNHGSEDCSIYVDCIEVTVYYTTEVVPVPGTYTISGTICYNETCGEGPLPGVTVTASGGFSDSTTTNGAGVYTFFNVANGTSGITIMPALDGYTFYPEYYSGIGPVTSNLTYDFTACLVSGPVTPVGGTAYPVNKLIILLPWIALGAAITAGIVILERRRRRAQS